MKMKEISEAIENSIKNVYPNRFIRYTVVFVDSNAVVIHNESSASSSPWLPVTQTKQSKSGHVNFADSKSIEFGHQNLGDKLHALADTLPLKASILDVVLQLDQLTFTKDGDEFLCLYSALKRLSTWHNAKIITTSTDLGLAGFLPIETCEDVDGAIGNSHWWRGKLAIASREGSCRLHLAGVSLSLNSDPQKSRATQKHPSFEDYLLNTRRLKKDGVEFSRCIQVLEQVPCSSLPPFYLLPYIFDICQFAEFDSTTAFLEILKEQEQTGYIARLAYGYPKTKERKCATSSLSTKVWKESIISNISAANDDCDDIKQTAEYQALQVRDSTENVITRNRSLDVAMSSPFALDDSLSEPVATSDVLTLFNKDGSASDAASLSLKTKACVRGVRMPTIPSSELIALSWSDCMHINYHGIFYNRQTEKQESRYCKLRDRYVTNETGTSLGHCSLNLFCKRPTATTLCRRSSRIQSDTDAVGRSGRLQSDADVMTRKRNSDNMTPGSPDKLSKRRKIITNSAEKTKRTMAALSSNRRHSVQSTHHLSKEKITPVHAFSKENVTLSSKEKITLSSDVDKSTRRLSLDSDQKATRSQRHNQKLQDIVTQVLKSAGLEPTDPLYKQCATKLFQTTKIMVMDLPTSENLRQQMTQIAKSQVKQVIYIAKQKEKLKAKAAN